MGGNFISLSRKFFWILFAGVLFFFGMLTFFILQREKEIILNIHREEAHTTINLIVDDIFFMMLSKNHDEVADNIRAFNKSDRLKVGVVGPDGSTAFGTDMPIPPKHLQSQQEQFIATDDAYLLYKPLPNAPSCHGCHPPGDDNRGMLVIESSMMGAKQEIAATGRRLLWFAVVAGLVSEAFLLVTMRRYILNPVKQLSEGAVLLKSGRLEHRIPVSDTRDEISSLAESFNDMAASIKRSHDTLEDTVRQRTTELRVIAGLSTEVFRADRGMGSIIETFLSAITGPIGFRFAALCLIDRETGLLSREFRKGTDHGFCSMELSLAGQHPFVTTIRETMAVVRKAAEVGLPEELSEVAIIPVLSHQRQRCRETNLCTHENCPAFSSGDERCWLVAGTLCRSPQAVAGKEKIYGCLHCVVFPVIGVLIAGRGDGISDSSLHSLEILGAEVASAIENQRLIDGKKQDISKLIKLHDISVESLQEPGAGVASSIVTSITAFANMDAAALWMMSGDGRLHLAGEAGITGAKLPSFLNVEDSFIGKAIRENRPVETVRAEEWPCISDMMDRQCFLYAASVPLRFKDTVFGCVALFRRRDFLMTDAEKAITLLFASQASAALNTNRLFSDLRAEMEFSDAIFNGAASGIMVLDREGRLIKINVMGAEILHLNPLAAAGRKIVDLYPELVEVYRFGMGAGREIAVTCPGGSVIPVGFTNSPLYDDQDGSEGVIVLFRDLTEIKKLQSELRRKEHFEAMGRVLAGVAHEIRNPLFGISATGQILEREITTPQHMPLIQGLLRESDRMKRLLEELILYTRPSRLDLKTIDLNHLFEGLRLYVTAKRQDVTLIAKIPPLLAVLADNDKITQVFLNLLNNAADAARSTITLTAQRAGQQVEIEIADDGPGIEKNAMQHIFDPFFTTKKGGTGLGLPISRKIVEEHNGSLTFISADGAGATAVLKLPAGAD